MQNSDSAYIDAPSSRSSDFLSSIPWTAEKPPRPPSSLITRWQGMMMGKGLRPRADPDCAHGPGAPDCLSKPAIGSHLTVGNGGCRLPDLSLKRSCRGKIKGAVKTGPFPIKIFLQFQNRFLEAGFPAAHAGKLCCHAVKQAVTVRLGQIDSLQARSSPDNAAPAKGGQKAACCRVSYSGQNVVY